MASERSLRERLRVTVLAASTPAGKAYNIVIFGAILLSVLALLLEPDPLGNFALQRTNVLWIDWAQSLCLAVFAATNCNSALGMPGGTHGFGKVNIAKSNHLAVLMAALLCIGDLVVDG